MVSLTDLGEPKGQPGKAGPGTPPPPPPRGFSYLASVSLDCRDLARALALLSMVREPDVGPGELDARIKVIERMLRPHQLMDDYRHHASAAAFLVARLAVERVPRADQGLRPTPLDADSLREALVQRGLLPGRARALVGDWDGPSPDFAPELDGLGVSVIAGLAELSLSRSERNSALCQVAFSRRCLDRIATTARLLIEVRALLPVLPPESFGSAFGLAATAVVLGCPERAADLFGEDDTALVSKSIRRLVRVQAALLAGSGAALGEEASKTEAALLDEAEASAQDAAVSEDSEDADATDDVLEMVETSEPGEVEDPYTDDVLEIVEEAVDPATTKAPEPHAPFPTPNPVTWALPETILSFRDEMLVRAWGKACHARGTAVARSGQILSMRLPTMGARVAKAPFPPDLGCLRELSLGVDASQTLQESMDAIFDRGIYEEGSAYDPIFFPIEEVLGAVVGATKGEVPSTTLVDKSGDLGWVMTRTRALALVVRGEPEAAVEALSQGPDGEVPERVWARERMQRFGSRKPEPVCVERARVQAASLVRDFAEQLFRTVSGALPTIEA